MYTGVFFLMKQKKMVTAILTTRTTGITTANIMTSVLFDLLLDSSPKIKWFVTIKIVLLLELLSTVDKFSYTVN